MLFDRLLLTVKISIRRRDNIENRGREREVPEELLQIV